MVGLSRPSGSIKAKGGLGEGVYYPATEYAGIGRRLVGLVADLGVILLVGYALLLTLVGDPPHPGEVQNAVLITLAFAYIYLTVIKPSRLRSVGYWLTGTKVVTLHGQRPSILRMTFRLLLWALGPFNVVCDLIWMGTSDDRQSLRDVYAGTYVVKARAQPVGRGNIHLARYFAFGFALVYPKVTHRSQAV